MYFPSLISHSAELFRIMVKSPHSSDAVASDYLRSKRYIGSKERKFISGAAFAALRSKSQAEYIATAGNAAVPANSEPENSTEMKTILATVLAAGKFDVWKPESLLFPAAYENGKYESPVALCRCTLCLRLGFSPENAEKWTDAALLAVNRLFSVSENADSSSAVSSELAAAVAMPAWILENWAKNLGVAAAVRRAKAMLSAAPVGLRVNSLVAVREVVAAELTRMGAATRLSQISPDCILLDDRVNLTKTSLFTCGAFEVQDEGSQLIAYAAAPSANDTILDACAGAGGKALHLAALQRDAGRMVCSDSDIRRLRPIASRAARCGVRSIEINARYAHGETVNEYFDTVVVDAPCSGMGTIRRAPTIKWRLTAESLKKISRKQGEILRHYSRYVREGGILIYATCSLMTEENEAVVKDFLAENPEFAPDDITVAFAKNGVKIASLNYGDFFCSLSPDTHGTDGFFMARFIRRGTA